MTTYATGNPIGSTEVKDLFDNAQNFDNFINNREVPVFNDRLGVARKTWAGIETQAQLDIATAVADATAEANDARDTAQQARDDALAAAGAIGPVKFYATYAEAVAALPELAEDDLIEVARDEGRDDARTRYRVTDGTLVFEVNLDKLRQDIAAPDGFGLVGAYTSLTQMRNFPSLMPRVYLSGDRGNSYWDLDLGDTTTPDDDGLVIIDIFGNRRKRDTAGLIAIPSWWGLPLVSSNVDNTAKLQALLNCPRFQFPKGFRSHTSRLQLKSNCVGDFGDAVLTLLNGQSSGTQIVTLGKNFTASEIAGYTPDRCVNSVFFGGIFDGNKANNTAANNAGGMAGGDGGMHGIHVHDAENVHWYGPRVQNCGTDGIIVWQRRAGTVVSVIRDVHIHGPVSDSNGRQGVSVVSADDVHFYDSTWSNTGIGATGKAPRAGIDLEGNGAADSINAWFHGTTLCYGNVGRGFQTTTPATYCGGRFDRLIVRDNAAADAQFSIYGGINGAVNDIEIDHLEIFNGSGALISQAAGATVGALNKLRAGYMSCAGNVAFNGIAEIDIDRFDATSASTAFGTLNIYNGIRGRIGRATVVNTGLANGNYPVYLTGSSNFTIDVLETTGVRGVYLNGASNKNILQWTAYGALAASGLFMGGACLDNVINLKLLGTISADYPIGITGASLRNDISINWPDTTRSVINVSGAGESNRFKVIQGGSYTGSLFNFGASAIGNLIYSSLLKSTGAIASGPATAYKILGCVPFSVNSTS